MIEFKGEQGYLKIEPLVGAVGRLVFMASAIGDDGLDESEPKYLSGTDFNEIAEAYKSFDVRVNLALKKAVVGGVTSVTQCYAIYPVCSLVGPSDRRSSALALGGGNTPAFVPRTPHLEFTCDETGVFVDIAPIHSFAHRTFYGD